MLISQALQDFLGEQEYKGNSPRTLSYYRQRIEKLQRDTGIQDLAELTPRVVQRWLVSHEGCARNTLANYDRAVRVFCNWLEKRGYWADNPMAMLPKPRETPSDITVFTRDDLSAILQQVRRGRNPRRDSALITLLLDTGMRIGEGCSLDLRDVEWREGFVHVRGKVGGRSVPFGRISKRALRQYVDRERRAASSRVQRVFLSREGEPFESKQATQQLIRYARRAGITSKKVGPHNYRHTFAVEFIRAGGDAFTLQRLLGHATLDMTRRYVHLAQTDLREAHKRFSPAIRLL